MELTYKFKVKTSELKSSLIEAEDLTSSDFYLDKEQDWLSFSLDFNQSLDFDLEPKILHTESYNNKIEFRLNTLDVLLTDVKINSKLYYYKVIIESYNTNIELEDLILDTDVVDIVERDGVFYTNTPFYRYLSEGNYYYTHPILNVEEFKVIYETDYITLITPSNISLKLKDTLIEPKLINEYTYYIPSFYLINKKTGLVDIRCIESNIKEFKSTASIKPNKHLPYQIKTFYKGLSNLFNLSFLKNTPRDLVYRESSHHFRVYKNTTYFNITFQGDIQVSDETTYIFKIKRDINLENISIIKNTYSDYTETSSNPHTYVNVLYDRNPDINDYGVIYTPISSGIPKTNYISNIEKRIYSNNCSIEVDKRLLTKSMKEDTVNIRKNVEVEDQAYKKFDNIYYYSKDRDLYDYD